MVKMINLLMAALAVVTGVLADDFYGPGSNVIELTDSNFQSKVLNSDEIWIVEFYAPWCGHCQQFKPSYEKAARVLKGVVKVGAINVDQHKQSGSQFGITGFPTVKLFGFNKKDKPVDFQQQRTAEEVVKFAL